MARVMIYKRKWIENRKLDPIWTPPHYEWQFVNKRGTRTPLTFPSDADAQKFIDSYMSKFVWDGKTEAKQPMKIVL